MGNYSFIFSFSFKSKNHKYYGIFYLSHLIQKIAMETSEILKADFLDILFYDRNKQYGAYDLRKYYSGRLAVSLFLAVTVVGSLIFLLNTRKFIATNKASINSDVVVHTHEIPVIKKDIIQQVKQKQHFQMSRKRFMNIKIVEDDKIKNNMDDPDRLSLAKISNINGGIEINEDNWAIGSDQSSTETLKTKTEGEEKSLESAPEFPGGMKAWLNFLNKNLITPGDLEPGEKKTVVISFQVSENGSINKFKVLQSGGDIYDNEVIRVLMKMPKWKPAVKNGHAITTTFSQPVTFIVAE